MNKPYITCHMVTSIDGKVTGDFLSHPGCEKATEIYYQIHRDAKADGFICGRITMESSFTKGWYPDLSDYAPIVSKEDFVPACLSPFYAVAFDPKGRLGWQAPYISDEDPGYDNARVVEVLTTQADGRYLAYLRKLNIPYIFAGEDSIHVPVALEKLHRLFGAAHLLLEGGSIVNGSFLRAGMVDALSLVVAPIVADQEALPLFDQACLQDFRLERGEIQDQVWVVRYQC